MAIDALARRHRVRSGQGETGAGVVEFAVRPKHGVMAALARGREMRTHVVYRAERSVVVGLMAAHAGRCGDVVIPVYVAVRALARRHCVRTSQRECRVGVIEGGVGPDCGVVAQLTRGWESRRSMGGVVGARIILLMARVAQRAV